MHISIFGTSSDSGKSTLTFIIGRILQNAGYSVTPFKAQNTSNNSKVTKESKEISIAQFFQAEALGIKPLHQMNPILLKSAPNSKTHMVIEGTYRDTQDIKSYFGNIESLKPIVKRNFEYLASRFDVVIAEGAGSPVELNLMEKDLSNIYVAEEFETHIILVADIEKGGVFASIYGVLNLLPPKLKKNIIGVIINKFRGDISLFDEGVRIIEEDFGVPVLGVIPYMPLNLGFEDSQSLLSYSQKKPNAHISLAIIALPHMSNYNDFEPLILDGEIEVTFLKNCTDLESYDVVILPGSKLVIEDLQWLKSGAFFDALRIREKMLVGICGGYEMLFCSIDDSKGVESSTAQEVGLGFIEDTIYFQQEKILKNAIYEVFGQRVEGFEIHNGTSAKHPLYFARKNIYGTFLHGIFDNDNLRNWLFKKITPNYRGYAFKPTKQKIINDFCDAAIARLDSERILQSVC